MNKSAFINKYSVLVNKNRKEIRKSKQINVSIFCFFQISLLQRLTFKKKKIIIVFLSFFLSHRNISIVVVDNRSLLLTTVILTKQKVNINRQPVIIVTTKQREKLHTYAYKN